MSSNPSLMTKRRFKTKAELLERISRGPAAIARVYQTTMYRVSVTDDEDPNGGVWMSLSDDGRFIVEDYAQVFVRVDGREVHLTQKETNEVRKLIATAMRLRATPWRHDTAKPPRRRRQNVNGASKGGKMRSPTGSTTPEASEKAA